MRATKSIAGVTTFAAIALFSLGLAPSASANAKVCSTGFGTHTPTIPCSAGHGYVYSGSIIAATAVPSSKSILTSTSASGPPVTTITCSGSSIQGTVDGTTGSGTITGLLFESCSSPLCFAGVHVTTPASPTKAWAATLTTEVAGVINTKGRLDISDMALSFVCTTLVAGNITCSYTAASESVRVLGGSSPEITANNVLLVRTAGPDTYCGVKIDWQGAYRITTPSSLYVE
jgi:hypothetical protein